ncbi:MAG: hypothetical protein QGG01_11445, partial [Roseibacillus sp.]|nr:hypothetical protein [Roseibacillus sp.]
MLPTKVFQSGDPPVKTEFVRLKKGEKWLVHAVCGPMRRQCGLSRTSMVESLITAAVAAFTAAFAAAEGDAAAAIDAAAIDDARRPHDPMVDFSFGDDDSPPQEAGDTDETPKKKTQKRTRVRDTAVTVEMPDKCREKYPKSTGV